MELEKTQKTRMLNNANKTQALHNAQKTEALNSSQHSVESFDAQNVVLVARVSILDSLVIIWILAMT